MLLVMRVLAWGVMSSEATPLSVAVLTKSAAPPVYQAKLLTRSMSRASTPAWAMRALTLFSFSVNSFMGSPFRIKDYK